MVGNREGSRLRCRTSTVPRSRWYSVRNCCSLSRSLSTASLRSATTAATGRFTSAMIAMKAWSKSSEAFWVAARNGPAPWSVPQMAMPESRTITVAVSRGPNRNAAQASRGTVRYSNEKMPPNTTVPTIRTADAGESGHQSRANQSLQCIPDRNAHRGDQGPGSGQVGEKRAGEHAGPHAGAQQQDRRQGDPGRRPHHCRAGIQERQLQAEFGGNEVARSKAHIGGNGLPDVGNRWTFPHRTDGPLARTARALNWTTTLLRILGDETPKLLLAGLLAGLSRDPPKCGAGFVRLARRHGEIRVLGAAKLIRRAAPHLHVAGPVVGTDLRRSLRGVLVARLHGGIYATCDEHQHQQPDDRTHGVIPPR